MRYENLKPASAAASTAARGASKKKDTKPELALRRALRERGLRSYRVDLSTLQGRPDVAFTRERVAVFATVTFGTVEISKSALRGSSGGTTRPIGLRRSEATSREIGA
ncbi:MAG: hypothetical protein AB7O24_30255 [Kofleriaceae bacterium]